MGMRKYLLTGIALLGIAGCPPVRFGPSEYYADNTIYEFSQSNNVSDNTKNEEYLPQRLEEDETQETR